MTKNEKTKVHLSLWPSSQAVPHLFLAVLLNPAVSSFSRGHISGSINVPFSSAFSPDGELVQCPATGILQSYRGRVIVVISHAMKSAAMVREQSHTHTHTHTPFAQHMSIHTRL